VASLGCAPVATLPAHAKARAIKHGASTMGTRPMFLHASKSRDGLHCTRLPTPHPPRSVICRMELEANQALMVLSW